MAEKAPVQRIASASIALVVLAFVFLSLVSFDVRDWPNPDVAPQVVQHNLCGRAGALIAYHAHYYLGPASLALLLAIGAWVVCRCMQKPIEQFALRVIGVLLVA
ncbi:MAG: DNA translocase FtsK 4TM domain-containing protein, partial [Phycisphaerae bacterium]|nr:DNA translocase FtsK 4TM domain-containing protein [Phycisphaerae bacterium]